MIIYLSSRPARCWSVSGARTGSAGRRHQHEAGTDDNTISGTAIGAFATPENSPLPTRFVARTDVPVLAPAVMGWTTRIWRCQTAWREKAGRVGRALGQRAVRVRRDGVERAGPAS